MAAAAMCGPRTRRFRCGRPLPNPGCVSRQNRKPQVFTEANGIQKRFLVAIGGACAV